MGGDSVYMCLITFFTVTSVLCNQKDCYRYQTDFTHRTIGSAIDLELLENEVGHTYHKRDVQETVKTISSSNGSETLDTRDEIPIPPPKKKSVKLQKTLLPTNGTKLSTKDFLTKLVDVDKTEQSNSTSEVPIQSPSVLNISGNVWLTPPLPSDVDADSGQDTFNQSLADHNITNLKTDNHLFYNSSCHTDPEVGHYYWVDLENRTDVRIHELLSKSHRRAATIKLSFDFPFYGHLIKNVTIATGGFLYTGDYIHSWLAATQYIAPLMANFDNSISNNSCIKYVDNGTAFTVQWERVSLQEKPNDGEFTFQVTLHKNGDIVFVYQTVPLLVEDIQDVHHPVKVGLSDAYIMDRTIFFVRRKTIYEYHRVNFPKEDIKNWTVIYLKALPTCLDSHDCFTCLTKKIPFECLWCSSINKCSTGTDRYRQDWMTLDCHSKRIDNVSMCSQDTSSDNVYFEKDYNIFGDLEDLGSSKASQVYTNLASKNQQENVGVSGIVAILFLIAMVSGLAVWIFYAYRNPHTISGQILIRYRPSQWEWKRGEARYTAATIHM